MWPSAKAAWADSFYLSVRRSPVTLSPLSLHTKKNRNCEKSTAPLPWQGLWLFNGTLRGMTISMQQICTRTERSAFRKLSQASVFLQVSMPSKYSAQRMCWAQSDPGKLSLWRQRCHILKSSQLCLAFLPQESCDRDSSENKALYGMVKVTQLHFNYGARGGVRRMLFLWW